MGISARVLFVFRRRLRGRFVTGLVSIASGRLCGVLFEKLANDDAVLLDPSGVELYVQQRYQQAVNRLDFGPRDADGESG